MALASVRLNDIPKEGLHLSLDVTAEDLALTPEDGRLRDGLSLSVEFVRADRDVTVTGVLSGTVLRECVRCLVEYEDRLRLPFTAAYRRLEGAIKMGEEPRKGSGPPPSESSERPGVDEESYWYVGDKVDLAAMLREQVILATPMQPLCDERCSGLCPVCGQNRNERECGCQEPEGLNPFQILRRHQGLPRKG